METGTLRGARLVLNQINQKRRKGKMAKKIMLNKQPSVLDPKAKSIWNKQTRVEIEFTKTIDTVNHPSHYNNGKIECIEYLEDQFMSRPHEWNAVKYITRANAKGKEIEDLEKAIFYLRRKIALLKGNAPRPNDMPQERA